MVAAALGSELAWGEIGDVYMWFRFGLVWGAGCMYLWGRVVHGAPVVARNMGQLRSENAIVLAMYVS